MIAVLSLLGGYVLGSVLALALLLWRDKRRHRRAMSRLNQSSAVRVERQARTDHGA